MTIQKLYCIPGHGKTTIFSQYLIPKTKFQKTSLICNYIFSKYYLKVRSMDNLDILRGISLKTREIILIHSLPENLLSRELSKLRKINSKSLILKSSIYFLLLPISSLGPDPINILLELGISFLLFRNIQKIRGSLVLERAFRESQVSTDNSLDVKELEDFEDFEKRHRIMFVKEKLSL